MTDWGAVAFGMVIPLWFVVPFLFVYVHLRTNRFPYNSVCNPVVYNDDGCEPRAFGLPDMEEGHRGRGARVVPVLDNSASE